MLPSNEEDAEDKYYEELEKQVPDLMSILEYPEFFKWLEQKDKYNGESRRDLYMEASNRFDANKVAFFFKQFKQFREKKDKPQRTGYKRDDYIGQNYEVYDVLGMGGFGIVYLVYSHATDEVYALKTFRDEYLEDAQTKERFRKEAQIWIELERSPYLVRAYFVEEISGRLFIAMEFIAPDEKGLNSLDGYLRLHPPDLAQSLRWAIQFCYGIEYAYSKGIRAHRDIKPANIMIGHDKTVKISDFGLAGVIGMSRGMSGIKLDIRQDRIGLSCQTREGTGFGTPTHMPPEQFANATGCDERCDIYSFGIVLYQMATSGRLPFLPTLPKNDSVEESIRFWNEMYRMHSEAPVPKLNSPLFPIIQKCLNKKPDKRYSSFRELRSDIEPLLKKLTGELITPPTLKELGDWEWVNKGVSLKILGKSQEAIACYNRAMQVNPRNISALLHKGMILSELGKPVDAIGCFDRILEINPIYPNALLCKGTVLNSLGNYHKAIDFFLKLLEIDPTNVKACCSIGLAFSKLCKYQEALDWFNLSLSDDSELAIAWLGKGSALYSLGRFQEALDCYEKVLEINPMHAFAWYKKGCALSNIGNHQEAISCYDKAIELDPTHVLAWYGKAISEDALGRRQGAAFSFKKFIELAPAEYEEKIEYARQRLKDLTEK